MKKAIYHAPGVLPKTYDCQHGATPGTVDLLNAAGRIIVSGLPVKPAAEITTNKACAVLVVEVADKVKAPKKTQPLNPSTPEPLNSSTPEPFPIDTPSDTSGS